MRLRWLRLMVLHLAPMRQAQKRGGAATPPGADHSATATMPLALDVGAERPSLVAGPIARGAEGCRYDVTQRPSSFHTAIA